MVRLPTPGSDNGTWGSILNAFLLQEHTADGRHNMAKLLGVPAVDGMVLASSSSSPGWKTLGKADVGLGSVTNDAQLKLADLDTDAALAANSDTKIPSQKAIKAYASAQSVPLAGVAGRRPSTSPGTLYDAMESGWADFYTRGTTSTDTTDFIEGKASQKIVTNIPSISGDWCGVVKSISADFSQCDFHVWVKADAWANVYEADILFSTAGTFSSYFTAQVNGGVDSGNNLNPPDGEWIELVISRAACFVGSSAGGAPNWATVNKIILRAAAKPGQQCTVRFDGFAAIPSVPKGAVSVVFDDGNQSDLLVAKPYLDTYGFRAGSFIEYYNIGGLNGTSPYLTQAEIGQLHAGGWDIGGHGYDRLTTLTSAQRIQLFQDTKRWLASHGYRGADIYAYPNSTTNATIKAEISPYFSYARTISSLGQPLSHVIPLSIQGYDVYESLSTATVQSYIDRAANNGEWVVLLFHRIINGTASGSNTSLAKFQTIVDYLHTTGVKVAPMSEILQAGTGRWGAITGALADQTDLQAALNAKATDGNVVHLAGPETVTGTKTFSAAPVFSQVNDVNGNQALGLAATASATNYINLANSTSGNPPTIAPAGAPAAIQLKILSKGASAIALQPGGDSQTAVIINNAVGTKFVSFDSTNSRLRVGDANTPKATLDAAGSFARAITSTAKTAAYSIAATDSTITCDATGAAFAVTLPDATAMQGRLYTIKKVDASANAVTIGTSLSQTIDGATTQSLGAQWQKLTVQSTGTAWVTI